MVSVTVSDGLLSDQRSVTLEVVTPNGLLSGAYSFAGFEHDFTNTFHVAVTGTLTFDGAGAYTSAMTVNMDGTIGFQAPASTYSLNAAGDITLDDGSGGTLAGGLDAAHEVAVVSRITPARHPLIVIAVKRSGTYSQLSLSGDYHVAAYHWDGGGGAPAYAALTGVGTFDPAAGTFGFTATNNWGGTVNPVSLAVNYAVAADGTLTLSDPAGSGILFNGGVMTGGDIMVGASTSVGGKPMMLVAIRKSGIFTASTLSGPHRALSIGSSGAGASSWIGERIFDGEYDWTASGTLNDNGTVSTTFPLGTYSVTPEGHMTMTATPSVFMLGVREAGTAATGAAITSGEAPRFVFSVRK